MLRIEKDLILRSRMEFLKQKFNDSVDFISDMIMEKDNEYNMGKELKDTLIFIIDNIEMTGPDIEEEYIDFINRK